MLTLWFVTDWINEGFHSFLLLIDAVVYWFVSVCYNLFVFLATEPIFKEEFFTDFARRIYAILGVFMLFYLAYALLNALVDPEKLSKGDKSVSKLAMNLVISLILLGLSPTIFNYAYRLQNYILSSNLIGAIVMGSELEETNSITNFGDELSFTVMNTFINPENNNAYMGDNEYWSDYEESVKGDEHDYMGLPGLSKCVTKGCVIKSDDGSEGSNKKVITYYPFVSTGAGIFLIYIILSFTLDLGVRVFKFAFCQLLAPIPIVMRAMPGKKAQFDKWLKLTITVYLEVFVRVGCMYLAIYFIQALRKNITFTELFKGSKIMGMIALVILIMGVFSFAKQAPKMLSEMLGFDSGSLKLGIGEKLKAGGAFVGGAMIGAGATGLVRNAINGVGKMPLKSTFNSFKNGDFKNGFAGVGKSIGTAFTTFGSSVAGAASGGFNAFKAGKDAKNFGDMATAAGKGADVSWQNKNKREAFYHAHGGFMGGMEAHLGNVGDSASTLLTGKKPGTLTASQQHVYDVLNDYKNRVKNFEGLWKNEKAWIDADATARNSRVQATVSEQLYQKFASGDTKAFADEINSVASNPNNIGMSSEKIFEQAYDNLASNGATDEELRKYIDNYDNMLSAYSNMKTAAETATRDQITLEATMKDIQKSKQGAIDANKEQLKQFLDAHKDVSEYLGAGVTDEDTNKIDKAYMNKLNELNSILAKADINSDKGKK